VAVFAGRSGAGKTTLLNLVGGLARPTSGKISVCQQDLIQLGESRLADFRREKVGFVFQAFHLIEAKTALANVLLPLKFTGLPPAQARQRALDHLESVGLADIALEKVQTFSAGQKQRTALARGLVNEPDIVIADEPTGNLDAENSRAVFEILQHNAVQYGRTILIATHDTGMLPDGIDRRFTLNEGRLSDAAATA